MINTKDSQEAAENRDVILKKIREAKDASLILKDDIAYTGVGQTLEEAFMEKIGGPQEAR